MHEWVLVTTPGTLPSALRRVRIVRVDHFNDKMAV